MPSSFGAPISRLRVAATPVVAVGRWGVLALVSLLLIGVFWIVEHDPIYANAQITEIKESEIRDKYIDQIAQGNALRQVALLSYAAFGVAALVAASARPVRVRWWAAGPLLLLLGWTLLSVAWSAQPMITLKREVILACVLVGSAGLARLLGPRDLLLVSLVTIAAFIAASLGIDLALGGRPWQGGDYRFGGTLHPNAQATYCGVLCMAAITQPIGFGRNWVLRLLFAGAAGLIVLTQSRTGLLSLGVATVAVSTLRLSSLFRWAGMAAVAGAIALGVVGWNSVGDGVRSGVVGAVLLGRTEQSGSLTGRVPLWEELAEYSAKRPITGYGYEGFWTDDRIADIMKSQNWTLQNAHNSYFEIVLQVGWVGFVLAMLFLFAGTGAVVAAYDRTREPGYAFLFGVLVLGMTNSLLESIFVKLRYMPAIALTGLLLATLFFPAATDDDSAVSEPAVEPSKSR